MAIRNNKQTYGSVAKFFHWLVFIIIAVLISVGFIMSDMENSPDKFRLYGLHKSFGALLLGLALFRLIWKLSSISPDLSSRLNTWQKHAAVGAHWVLYGLMIVMPLSGWAMSSAAGFPVSVFGLFTLPPLMSADKDMLDLLKDAHELIAYVIIGMVALHSIAALVHHFYYRDNTLRKMLPFVKEGDDV